MARAIMISEHVYNELSGMKKSGESYTKVIDRLIHSQTKKDFMQFAGAWKFLDKNVAISIEKEAKKARKNWRTVPSW